jgi:hypothetical protein
MKLTRDEWFGAGRRLGLGLTLCLMAIAPGGIARAQAVTTTTVQGTVYLANGQVGAGTLSVSWPAFTTANGQAIAAGRTIVTIAPDGFVSTNLAPNVGATPAGLYYTAVYQMKDGTTSTEYRRFDAAKLFGVFNGIVHQPAARLMSMDFGIRKGGWSWANANGE